MRLCLSNASDLAVYCHTKDIFPELTLTLRYQLFLLGTMAVTASHGISSIFSLQSLIGLPQSNQDLHGAYGGRTHDLLLAKQALSQLS